MKRLILLIAGIAAAGMGLELLFRALPVYAIPERAAFSAAHPGQAWRAHQALLYSRGIYAERPTRHRSNALGMINGGVPDSARTVWIYGDSYVEAQMHAYENTLQGQLAQLMGKEEGSVASFNSSGGNFADYLDWVRAAGRLTRSPVHVVVVSLNDYGESFLFGDEPGRTQNAFRVRADGSLRVEYGRWKGASTREWLKKSALLRYVFLNLRFQPASLLEDGLADGTAAASGRPPPERLHLYERAASAWLDSMRAAANSRPLLLVLDCKRERLSELYLGGFMTRGPSSSSPSDSGSFPGDDLKERFARRAAAQGLETLDLCPEFSAWMAVNHRALDMRPSDRHWNEAAHAVAARAVHARLAANGWVPLPPGD